jgi:hypothetical protein
MFTRQADRLARELALRPFAPAGNADVRLPHAQEYSAGQTGPTPYPRTCSKCGVPMRVESVTPGENRLGEVRATRWLFRCQVCKAVTEVITKPKIG